MKRLLILCLAAALAAPAAFAGGFNGFRDRDRPGVDIFGPLVLWMEDGARWRPLRMVALSAGDAAGLAIPHPAQMRDEDRIPLGALPVIGGVFEPTARMEFAEAVRVGEAWRAGDALVIGSGDGAALTNGVRRVVIANRGVSFHLPAGFAAEDGPAPGGGRLPVGRVYRAGDALLVVVDPSLADPEG